MEPKFVEILGKSFSDHGLAVVLSWVSRKIPIPGSNFLYGHLSLTEIRDTLKEIFEEEISNEKKDKKEVLLVQANVNNILNEIACSYSQPLIRSLGFAFAIILRKQFSGVHVSETSLLKIKSLVGKAPVIFIPSHRSYCDFILMAYICFTYDIFIPCVAAGIDFKTMKLIGWLLSYCKAFFMRRSFSFDEFYKKVFSRYLQFLVVYGKSPIEFFIEGTRSRTGKPLTPKFGLLKNVIETYISGDVPDLIFIPVSLSYDRILEDLLFSYEVLGVPKPKESTSGFLKAVNMLDEKYGNVFVNFGEPISLREYTRAKNLSKENQTDCVTMMEDLANDLITSQQQLHTISTINILCLVLNDYYVATGFVSVSFDSIIERIKSCMDLAQLFGASIIIPNDWDKAVRDCLVIHKSFITLNEDEEMCFVPCLYMPSYSNSNLKGAKICPNIMKSAVPILKMNLYIGPLMHYLWVPSTLLLLIRHHEFISKDELMSEFLFLNTLFASEFSYGRTAPEEVFDQSIDCLKQCGLIYFDNEKMKLSQNYDPRGVTLVCTMYPAIITYECTYHLLCKDPLLKKSNHFIMRESQNLVQERIVRKYHYHHASLSLDSVVAALDSLIKIGALNRSIVDGTPLISVTNITILKKAHLKLSSLLTHFECLWIKKRHPTDLSVVAKL